jgi:hypothetical protein
MFEYMVAVGLGEALRLREEILDARPGGIVRVSHPRDIQRLYAQRRKTADCEGCGAPLKAYIHHCEYCRRPI